MFSLCDNIFDITIAVPGYDLDGVFVCDAMSSC